MRKDGTQFWANVVITALLDATGKHIGFAKVTRDLTDRGYRAFVEATHAIVWTTDASGAPNADSPSWRAFTGQTEERVARPRGWDPVHPDDVGALRIAWPAAKAAEATVRGGVPAAPPRRRVRVDGVPRDSAARRPDGEVREWFGVTFDISARKHAELERERAIELVAHDAAQHRRRRDRDRRPTAA